jgi:hypothetical protein
VCSCILSLSVQPRSNGVIGAEGTIGRRACSSCVINAWKSRWKPGTLPFQRGRLRLFPVPSGPMLGCRGQSGSLAMRVLWRLEG